jgi:AmmeMemoRadiSam system protein A
MLNDADRHALVDAARRAVAAQVSGDRLAGASPQGLPAASGVFVTLKHHGELRGCLGTVDHVEDLGREVIRCAADAAHRDPRFSPVTPRELAALSVEVSVLGPLERIDPTAPGSIAIGRHGLVVEQGHHRGLLLPQVAVECGWTVDQFLDHTCVKARLPADAWKRGAEVFRFDADVFGD